MEEPDSSRTVFWSKRWDAGKAPWDLGGIPPSLLAYLNQRHPGGRVLIPGCGSGYEVRAFHEAGHDVTAIEFAATAVAHAKELLGPLGDKVIQANFFKHDFGVNHYDIVYERGFLCSLPMDRWADYAARMASLIAPGGRLLGMFLYGEEPEPPPFPLTEEKAQALLGGSFELLNSARVAGSVPVYEGMERWQEWRRKPVATAP